MSSTRASSGGQWPAASSTHADLQPHATPVLTKQTVVQLKALCKQLGIQGISKLNKAQLINKIEVTTSTTTAATQESGTGLTAAATPSVSGRLSLNTTTSGQTLASDNVPSDSKQSTESTVPGASLDASLKRHDSAALPSSVGTAGVDTTAPAPKKRKKTLQPSTNTATGTAASPSLIDLVANSSMPRPSTTNSTLQQSVAAVFPVPSHRHAVTQRTQRLLENTVPANTPGPDDHSRRSPPCQTSGLTSPRKSSHQDHHQRGEHDKVKSEPPSAKPTSVAVVKRNPHPRIQTPGFLPLKTVAPQQQRSVAFPQEIPVRFPLSPLPSHERGTRSDRIAHVRSHFLERAFANLEENRRSVSTSLASHSEIDVPLDTSTLSFNGFHTTLYNVDNDAFLVALRWWIARMATMLSLGSGEAWSSCGGSMGLLSPDMATWPIVVNSKQLTRGIYLVTAQDQPNIINPPNSKLLPTTPTTVTHYLTIGATGDIIATSRAPKSDLMFEGCPVRQDWYTFLTCSVPGTTSTTDHSSTARLLALVRTKDQTEAPKGINRAWIAGHDLRHPIVDLAERAVLASCALNSFSGTKMQAVDMDAEWLGVRSCGGVDSARSNSRAELYLPESAQVLSVHLLEYPAIGVVHRASGRSDYVLRDTGHVVGDEDGGVAELWQGILGCDSKGKESDSRAFWDAWAERLVHCE